MPIVNYHASNFPPRFGARLSGTHSLAISWAELVWAAVTVGKPGLAYLLSHDIHSISDIIVRSHTVYANLRQAYPYIKKSSLYEDLDPTEKGAASYFLGMMAAKIICSRLINTPYVFHLSMLKGLGGTAVLQAKSQPDLIGRDHHGNWVVAEAKGRTNGFSEPAMTAAKLQTRQLRMINGSYPSLRVAVQAYFSSELNFAVTDPEEYDDAAQDIDFDLGAAFRDYYSQAIETTQATGETRKVFGREYLFRSVEEVGVSIGIDASVLKRIETDSDSGSFEERQLAQPVGEGDDEQGTVAFPDGLAVLLDQRWAENRMRRDPRTRRVG